MAPMEDTECSLSRWLGARPQAHDLAQIGLQDLCQLYLLCPVLCPALAELFVPFAQHIVSCCFHKIMGTCPPHIFKFPLPRLDQRTAFLSLLFAFGWTPLPTVKNYVVFQQCIYFALANS